jgi:hypothetical protein
VNRTRDRPFRFGSKQFRLRDAHCCKRGISQPWLDSVLSLPTVSKISRSCGGCFLKPVRIRLRRQRVFARKSSASEFAQSSTFQTMRSTAHFTMANPRRPTARERAGLVHPIESPKLSPDVRCDTDALSQPNTVPSLQTLAMKSFYPPTERMAFAQDSSVPVASPYLLPL